MSRASTSQSTPQYQRTPSNYNNQAFAPHGNNFAAKLAQQQSRPNLNPQQSAAAAANQAGMAGQNSRKRKGVMRDGAERESQNRERIRGGRSKRRKKEGSNPRDRWGQSWLFSSFLWDIIRMCKIHIIQASQLRDCSRFELWIALPSSRLARPSWAFTKIVIAAIMLTFIDRILTRLFNSVYFPSLRFSLVSWSSRTRQSIDSSPAIWSTFSNRLVPFKTDRSFS